MKRWIIFGRHITPTMKDEIFIQFMANVLSAMTTAVMIGGYHFFFHM